MFCKYILKDWSSSHFLDCGWYLDYPKDCTPSLEIALYERFDFGFQSRLRHLLATPVEASKKRGKRKGKEWVKEIDNTLDTTREYIKVPLHGNTPSMQIILHGFLKVVVPYPP